MNNTNDEQVAAILARGVARVRAMDVAGQTTADGEQAHPATIDNKASSEQHGNTKPEATR